MTRPGSVARRCPIDHLFRFWLLPRHGFGLRHCLIYSREVPPEPSGYIVLGRMACATGSTFGDNTSPGNFEVIAIARKQLAKTIWSQDDTVTLAKPYLPHIELAPPPPPTLAENAQFVHAERNSMNPGVFDHHGYRLPPQFDHHVDENLYGDVAEHMLRTVSSSVLAL